MIEITKKIQKDIYLKSTYEIRLYKSDILNLSLSSLPVGEIIRITNPKNNKYILKNIKFTKGTLWLRLKQIDLLNLESEPLDSVCLSVEKHNKQNIIKTDNMYEELLSPDEAKKYN